MNKTFVSPTDDQYLTELKTPVTTTLAMSTSNGMLNELINRTNNYKKLIRILSFIFRFICNARNCKRKHHGPLDLEEYVETRDTLIRDSQVQYFPEELLAKKRDLPVSNKSKLKPLNPFLDKKGLIRVGGRLSSSNLNYNKKYPIILPPDGRFKKLIMEYFHKRDLHVGPQSLLHSIHQQFWPINGRNVFRKVVHECLTCFKMNPTAVTQLMGNLPSERISPSPPFTNTGIDLCGPFQIKYMGQKKGILQRIYICIFICLAIKAVHFEFLTDLTSKSLIAGLKRFFARRGKSSAIFSDNARNFVGARSELQRLEKLVKQSEFGVASYLVSEGIVWKFLPPRAPNFGGLWEARR
ncbi:uncharacterized protein LOC118194902 [Stegodyphus dumicola]|uniref:uncharacterized protein LOC118194902 n=1 Tax=Stegodyphus dumicola TaxID=202533 RepID=UPI0015AE04B3|nr:uncharacterized protein LOC118194902 [Stegodyphus dumicola]